MAEQGYGVVRPLPGSGLVARMGGLLLVCDGAEAAGGDLLEALRETAASGGDGRALARRAAQVLARTMTGEPASCAVAGPAQGGVAVLVSGSASATVTSGDGETRLAGSDSLTWTDRLVHGPLQRVELRLPDAGQAHPAVRLDGGVVVGGGVQCDFAESGGVQARPMTAELPSTAFHIEPGMLPPRQEQHAQPGPAPQPVHEHVPVQQPPPYPMQGAPSGPQVPHPAPEPQGPPSEPLPPIGHGPAHGPGHGPGPASAPMPHMGPGPTPFEHGPTPYDHGPTPFDQGPSPFDQGPPPYDERPPLFDDRPQGGTGPDHPFPSPPEQREAPPEHGDDRPGVFGVDCKNDHFNDPRAPYCAVCGIELVQRTAVPYKGPRPSLGVLVLDDGMALPLESDYLLGRDPDRAPEVAGGTARPAKVTSPDGSVSRRHLRVALDGWDVNLVDLGSVNGTQIQPPGDPNFYDIPPNEAVTIAPGTTVRIGVSRTMRYEAHRG